jgi:hypothetical protein
MTLGLNFLLIVNRHSTTDHGCWPRRCAWKLTGGLGCALGAVRALAARRPAAAYPCPRSSQVACRSWLAKIPSAIAAVADLCMPLGALLVTGGVSVVGLLRSLCGLQLPARLHQESPASRSCHGASLQHCRMILQLHLGRRSTEGSALATC